jgi:hypothetical protein
VIPLCKARKKEGDKDNKAPHFSKREKMNTKRQQEVQKERDFEESLCHVASHVRKRQFSFKLKMSINIEKKYQLMSVATVLAILLLAVVVRWRPSRKQWRQ